MTTARPYADVADSDNVSPGGRADVGPCLIFDMPDGTRHWVPVDLDRVHVESAEQAQKRRDHAAAFFEWSDHCDEAVRAGERGRQGWSWAHTGGGCTALDAVHEVDGKRYYVMATDGNLCAPEPDCEEVDVGLYDADDDGCEGLAIHEVEGGYSAFIRHTSEHWARLLVGLYKSGKGGL